MNTLTHTHKYNSDTGNTECRMKNFTNLWLRIYCNLTHFLKLKYFSWTS
jgi:hypothetical protein